MAGFSFSFLTDRIFGVNRNEDTGIIPAGRTTDAALMEMLDGLSNGETIVGKILSTSEDSFKIITGNNITLSAKTQGGVSLKEGTSVLFEVSRGADKQVRLRPLYQNTADANTATTALRQAMLPINERSLELVARRMEYAEPIDRNSLVEAYKDVQNFENAPVKYIVDLQQMQIPITDNNLLQYESYMNMNNSISDGLDNIAMGLVQDLAVSLETGLEDFVNASLSLREFSDDLSEMPSNPIVYSKAEVMELTTELKERGITTYELDLLCSSETEEVLPEKLLSSLLTDVSETAKEINTFAEKQFTMPVETEGVIYEPSYTDETDNTVVPTDYPMHEEALLPKADKKVLSDILEIPSVKEVFSNTLVSRGIVDKEKIFDKKETVKMYGRLLSETNQLLMAMEGKFQSSGQTASMVNNLQQNVDFMNALNTFVPYIQIPFGSENGSNNSELYVFKNRKSLTDKNSEITAFLHLDMKNLGPTDVFVSLKDAHVTTNFTLKDEETLSFIEKNIHFLDKRLTEKGYKFSFDAHLEKQMVSPVERMLNNTFNKIVVAKTSFDARA